MRRKEQRRGLSRDAILSRLYVYIQVCITVYGRSKWMLGCPFYILELIFYEKKCAKICRFKNKLYLCKRK